MNIVIIGAGRVGTALSAALSRNGHSIVKIISRSEENAEKLASALKCGYSSKPSVPSGTDLVVAAVNDDALFPLMQEISVADNTVIAHTAGSAGLEVFGKDIREFGVFYPLQTFTTGRSYDFSDIPIFVEGNTERARHILRSTASTLSRRVFDLDSDRRSYLHLAAVFSCNFVNHMYSAGKEITTMTGMKFDVLLPLLKETLDKAADLGPDDSQTGPAVRNDKNTIEKHLELLSFSPDLQNMYRVISDSIIKKYSGSPDG